MGSLKRIRRRQPTENTNGIGPHHGFHHAWFNTSRTLSEQRKSSWNENTWMGTERKDIWQTKKKKKNKLARSTSGRGLGAADRVLCKHCFWQASEHMGPKLDTMQNISGNKDLGWGKNGAGQTAAKCLTLSAELSCIRVFMSSCTGFLSPGPLRQTFYKENFHFQSLFWGQQVTRPTVHPMLGLFSVCFFVPRWQIDW